MSASPSEPPPWLRTPPQLSGRPGAPVHVQIERWLAELIRRGELVPGDRLPRESALAEALGVSRMTLRQALATMESLGTVVRTTGRTGGTVVVQPRIDCDLTGLAGFTEQIRRANLRAGARMISARSVPATAEVAHALSVRRGAAVYEIVRVRTAQRRPLALERSRFPAELLPGFLDERLTGSLYELLGRRYGHRPHTAREDLEPVIADATDAARLGVDVGAPLMQIERTAYTAAGLAIEYARDLFRPDRVRITLQTGIGSTRRPARLAVVDEG